MNTGEEEDIVAAGAHLLDITGRYQRLLSQQLPPRAAIDVLRKSAGPPFRFDAIDALEAHAGGGRQFVHASVDVLGLEPGMILEEAVTSVAGLMLLAAGSEVTEALIERIRRYADSSGVTEPIRALIPALDVVAAETA